MRCSGDAPSHLRSSDERLVAGGERGTAELWFSTLFWIRRLSHGLTGRLPLDHVKGCKRYGKVIEGAAQNGNVVGTPEIEREESMLGEMFEIADEILSSASIDARQ